MNSTNTVQILHCELRQGVSKKTGTPYKIMEAQCVISLPDENGQSRPQVAVAILPKTIEKPLSAGLYNITFGLGIDIDRRLVARVTDVNPQVQHKANQ